MADEREIEAIDRIEQALARIEIAAMMEPPRPDDGELRKLRDVHQALRGKVEHAIAQIDHLLEGGGRS
jgi:hypothetical protein